MADYGEFNCIASDGFHFPRPETHVNGLTENIFVPYTPSMDKKIPYSVRLDRWAKRRHIMIGLLNKGWTLQRIGDRYGISRQAVWRTIRSK